MHEDPTPYEVLAPRACSLNGAVDALLIGRWNDQVLVLVTEADRAAVQWVASDEVHIEWAPWSAAMAANA